MSQAICVLQPLLLVNTILSSTYWLFLLLLDFCLKPNTAHHFNPPPQLCRISPSLILILLPLFSLLSHSKVPVQELYKEEGGGGLSWGWSSWIPHHSNWQTFTKHWGISSYQLDYWSLRERLLYETNAGYHQDPGRGWSPTAIFIFSPLHF